MSHTYICTTCDRTYDEIPEDAIKLTGGRGKTTNAYTFPDGSFHSLKKVKAKKLNTPQPSAVVTVLAALPIPLPEPEQEIKTQPLPPSEPDFEEGEALTPQTVMSAAFSRIRK